MGSNMKFISRCLATEFKYGYHIYIFYHILVKMVLPMVLGWVFEVS